MSRMAQIAGIAIERRSAEDALRAIARRNFADCSSGVMEGVYRTARDGRLLVVNPAFVQMLGYASADEMLHQVTGAAPCTGTSSDRDMYVRRMESDGRGPQR